MTQDCLFLRETVNFTRRTSLNFGTKVIDLKVQLSMGYGDFG